LTAYPECALAKEAEICFANIAMPTDTDVYGLKPVTAELVVKSMKQNIDNVNKLLFSVIPRVPRERACECKDALKTAQM
jgi:5'-methylthioadenosine phosphorylase